MAEIMDKNVATLPITLVLHQPEIAGNTGTLMRLAVCWNTPLILIGPLGFIWSDRHFKRSGMDYVENKICPLYSSWLDYKENQNFGHRNIALVPHAGLSYTDFHFLPGDHLIMGSESSGLPSMVMDQCDSIVHIPMIVHARSLNLAVASAIVWSEALRQTNGLP